MGTQTQKELTAIEYRLLGEEAKDLMYSVRSDKVCTSKCIGGMGYSIRNGNNQSLNGSIVLDPKEEYLCKRSL